MLRKNVGSSVSPDLTNVLVSGALKPRGLQRTTFLLATPKPSRLYVPRPILEEYADVLSRPELRIRKGLRVQLLQLIKNSSHVVVPSRRLDVCSDSDDNVLNALTRRVPITLSQAIAGIFPCSGRRPKLFRPVNSSVSRHLI
jgi:hypothetical protein